jgi:HD-GYP domain-containing protein (c-di-GMP phosphodiesterase class II)
LETQGKTSEFNFHNELFRLVTQLNSAIINTHLYSFTHPHVGQYVEKAYLSISEVLQRRPDITVLLIGEDLVADNRPLQPGAPNIAKFVRILREKGVEWMRFLSGLPKTDFQGLVQDLASPDVTSVRSSRCIKLGKVEIRVNQGEGAETAEPLSKEDQEKLEALFALRDTKLHELKALYFNIKRRKRIDIRGVDDMVKEFIKGFSRDINPIRLLAPLKSADEYTFAHAVNACVLTMSQAEALGFGKDHLYQIGIASVLHDSGKLFIPKEILSKPGALTKEERAIMETHTVRGARYILGLEGIPKLAVLAALEHHIRYDGTGYPRIKGKWKPNIVSQIIAISDTFDAMRSNRPYSEAKPEEIIRKVLQEEKGKSFHPLLVERFLKLIKR